MSEEQKVVEVPEKFKSLVEQVEKMSVLDLSELVKVLEEKFGVSAAAPAMMMAAPAGDAAPARPSPSGQLHVFRARSLRTLSPVEADGLTLSQLVEPHAVAGRLMEEVLVAVARRDKAETLVAHEPFDRSVHRRHAVLL